MNKKQWALFVTKTNNSTIYSVLLCEQTSSLVFPSFSFAITSLDALVQPHSSPSDGRGGRRGRLRSGCGSLGIHWLPRRASGRGRSSGGGGHSQRRYCYGCRCCCRRRCLFKSLQLPATNQSIKHDTSIKQHTSRHVKCGRLNDGWMARTHSPLLVIRTVLVNAEAVNARHIGATHFYGHEVWVAQQEEVREGGAEERSVEVGVLAGARVVHLQTPRTEDGHRSLSRQI